MVLGLLKPLLIGREFRAPVPVEALADIADWIARQGLDEAAMAAAVDAVRAARGPVVQVCHIEVAVLAQVRAREALELAAKTRAKAPPLRPDPAPLPTEEPKEVYRSDDKDPERRRVFYAQLAVEISKASSPAVARQIEPTLRQRKSFKLTAAAAAALLAREEAAESAVGEGTR